MKTIIRYWLWVLAFGAATLVGGEIEVGGAAGEPMARSGAGAMRVSYRASEPGEVRAWLTRHGDRQRVDAESITPETIIFPACAVGYYDLTVQLRVGDELSGEKRSNVSVLPSGGVGVAEMGACVHFAQGKGAYPLSFELLTLAGFSRVRDDLAWETVEKTRGVYTMPEYAEKLVAACEEFGIRPLFVFGYPNAACYPNGFVGKPFPTSEEAREGCARALAYCAGYFGDRVTEWELWNEPNYANPVDDYLPLLKKAYPALKAANPAANLISGGGSGAGGGPGGGFIAPILQAGGVDCQDGWSIHPYMAPHDPDFGYEANFSPIPRVSIPVFAPFLQAMVAGTPRSDGKVLACWVTELGWNTAKVSEAEQAAYLARMFLLYRRENSSPGIFWYDFQDDGNDPAEPEHNFGLIRTDYAPKMAYHAAGVFAAVVGDRPFVKTLIDGENKVLGFGYDGEVEVLAAWTVKPEGATVKIALEVETHLDWQGIEQPLSANASDGSALQLGIFPQYWLVRR